MNRIPRAARKLDGIFLTDTANGKFGTHMIAEKTESGWTGQDDTGKYWRLFAEHMRNGNLCKISIIG